MIIIKLVRLLVVFKFSGKEFLFDCAVDILELLNAF